ncbi:MAG: SHOCT domain-containing protein [Kiritimatiellales bacterium]|nr:SHOCT domain-containing protein [Kiritimatiellales bacterium]
MKLKNPANLTLALLVLIASLSGCTHTLDIKNLNTYRNTTIMSLEQPIRVGIRSNGMDFESRNLVHALGSNLSKYNTRVTTSSRNDNSDVDVIANVSILSDHKGSGWNFLVNFPGFLVWAPAWHGYNYTVSHDITVTLSDAKNGKLIDTINVPIVLNIRHAAINRTWTEISWLEFGVIAFVGGIVFISYDDSITPDVNQKAGPVITDYIAQRVATSLQSYAPSISESPSASANIDSTKAQLEKLNSLKESGLLTEEEYQAKRKKLIDSL